ncbi:MAG TPA: DNA polymerase III subunit gamma/tau, partial [Halothiobacillus sp.]|nr:DNA polymerase III subunit gamma/tau [Halothiobacillus sp.]
DEVHMFSKSSFNALLKTLEEPPAHVKFLLATTDPQKLPVTVLSRCLQFNLRALSPAQIAGHLAHVLRQESIEFDSAGLNAIATAANGSMRDALSLLDQAIAFGGGRVERDAVVDMLGLTDHAALLDILRHLATGDASALFATLEQVMERAADPAGILAQLLELLHEIGLQQFLPQKNESADDPFAEARDELATALDPEQVQLWYQIALTGRRDLPYASSPRAGLEMTLLRMLAFLPSSAGAKTAMSRAATASASVPRTPPAQASVSPTSAKAAISSFEPRPAEASEPTSMQLATEVTAPAMPAVVSADAPWEQIIPQLGLKGPYRALAEHCALRREDGQALLVVSAEHAGAATEAIRSRLIEATSAFLGMPVKFVESGKSTMTTPASNRSQREAAARERARQELDESPAVQVLKHRAGASMIEDTLQLSDKEPTKE